MSSPPLRARITPPPRLRKKRPLQIEIVVFTEERIYARCLLKPGVYSLGQEHRNDIMVDEGSISGRHARIVIVNETALFIEDCESANGTAVDGQAVQERTQVRLTSDIVVGACRVQLRIKTPVS